MGVRVGKLGSWVPKGYKYRSSPEWLRADVVRTKLLCVYNAGSFRSQSHCFISTTRVGIIVQRLSHLVIIGLL